MENIVLLIEEQHRIEPVLEKLFKGTDARVVAFPELVSAKRSLIHQTPHLIIAVTAMGADPDAGFRFARELSGHEQFSQIPLVLVADELSEHVIREATACGAKALIPWPLGIESLRNRFKPFLSELAEAPAKAEQVAKPVAAPAAAKAPAPAPVSSAEKVHLAQQLLAKVLHNLKTSDLLEVIDLEDVPRVVSEITRALCGVQNSAPAKIVAPAQNPPTSASAKKADPDVAMDLDAAFGMKK